MVEDETLVPQGIATVLKTLKMAVDEAPSGEAALKMAKESSKKWDIALCDLLLPGIHGVETAKQLARIQPGIPIIFMSGYGKKILGLQGIETDAMPFLKKPFSIEELEALLLDLLS